MKWLKRAKKKGPCVYDRYLSDTKALLSREYSTGSRTSELFIQRRFYFRFWVIVEVSQRLVASDSTYRCFPYDDDLLESDKQGTPQMGS